MKIPSTVLFSYLVLAQAGHKSVLGLGMTEFVDQEEPSFEKPKGLRGKGRNNKNDNNNHVVELTTRGLSPVQPLGHVSVSTSPADNNNSNSINGDKTHHRRADSIAIIQSAESLGDSAIVTSKKQTARRKKTTKNNTELAAATSATSSSMAQVLSTESDSHLESIEKETNKRHSRMNRKETKQQSISATHDEDEQKSVKHAIETRSSSSTETKTIATSHVENKNNNHQQVLIKYKKGTKSNVMNAVHSCDTATMKEKKPNHQSPTDSTSSSSSVSYTPMSVMYDMDDMDIVVIDADEDVIDTLMKVRSHDIETIEVDDTTYEPMMLRNIVKKQNQEEQEPKVAAEEEKEHNDDKPSSKNDQERLLQEHLPWGVSAVQAPSVWDEGYTGSGVKVCVIDSGIDADHADFVIGNLEGVNINNVAWYEDACGHGTHVSGTIAAKDDNKGVVGVAPDATIMTMRVFTGVNPSTGQCAGASTSAILQAARECRNQGAHIINLSLGSLQYSGISAEVYKDLVNNDDILVVAAAGNAGNTAFSYPASYPEVMSVGAIRENGSLASFSQRNNQLDISAPGTNVWSTYNDGSYQLLQGTSMATPHVAGVAALLMEAVPDASASEIRSAMESTARDLGTSGLDNSFGHGMVQAKAALDKLRQGNGGGGGGGNGGGGSSNFLEFRNDYFSNQCIDVKDSQTFDGNYVQRESCNGSESQQWWHEGGTNYLRSALDINKCLVPSGGIIARGALLIVNTCFENDDRFKFNRYTDGSIRPALNTGLCVGPSWYTTIEGKPVIELRDCYGSHQQWTWS